MKQNNFYNKVYTLIKKIPKGKVATYKSVGDALNTKAYRAVGQALKHNTYRPIVPCHRIIKNNGEIGGFSGKTKGKEIQRKINMLKKEGIEVINNKIDLNKYLHKF